MGEDDKVLFGFIHTKCHIVQYSFGMLVHFCYMNIEFYVYSTKVLKAHSMDFPYISKKCTFTSCDISMKSPSSVQKNFYRISITFIGNESEIPWKFYKYFIEGPWKCPYQFYRNTLKWDRNFIETLWRLYISLLETIWYFHCWNSYGIPLNIHKTNRYIFHGNDTKFLWIFIELPLNCHGHSDVSVDVPVHYWGIT